MSRLRVVYVATTEDVQTGQHWPGMWVPLADAAGAVVAYWASARWPTEADAQAAADAWTAQRSDRRAFVGISNQRILDAVGLRPWAPEDIL